MLKARRGRRFPPTKGLGASLSSKRNIITSKQRAALLVAQLRSHLPQGTEITTELRFHPTRQWRLDVAIPAHRVAVEIEGGTWSGGRHTRGAGFADDCEKYAAAMLAGWRVLRAPTAWVLRGRAAAFVVALIDATRPAPAPAPPLTRRAGRPRPRRPALPRTHAPQALRGEGGPIP